jgi:Ion channel
MTTVGYGNQPPITRGGRLLVYSFGFFSILIFGAILGQAGSIVTMIVDDFFAMRRWHQVRKPRVACIMWGVMAFLWMLVIATQFVHFKRLRLDAGDEFDFSDGYWFAFISTLTVGLGDYYLDPEFLTGSDLVSFPLSFLIGFTFFSGFLGYFSQSVSSPFDSPKILADNLTTPPMRDETDPSG